MSSFRAIWVAAIISTGLAFSGNAEGTNRFYPEFFPSNILAVAQAWKAAEVVDLDIQTPALFWKNHYELCQMIERNRTWLPDPSIKVCFYGGNWRANQKIARVASEWSRQGHVRFDFGNTNGTSICRQCASNDVSDIRITYTGGYYNSAVGNQSHDEEFKGGPSMWLYEFDKPQPDEKFFRFHVLHEFGHALGLNHEHQNPISECETEFNWPVIYAELVSQKPPFYTLNQVSNNMHVFLANTNFLLSAYDRRSVMNYSFPGNYYLQGTNSPCFCSLNSVLSPRDYLSLSGRYPPINQANLIRAKKELTFITTNQMTPVQSQINFKERLFRVSTMLNE